jgi:KAP-like P-loop domain-containing protein
MDTHIVAKKIEAGSPELASLIGGLDIKHGEFQRGPGHQFLEKILQASISVPSYGVADMTRLVSSLVTGKTEPESQPADVPTGTPSKSTADSDEVKQALAKYGGGYFTNPRRLKRFVNLFRLDARLAPETRCQATVDQLARFLVLTEKWPGLVAYFRDHRNDLANLSQGVMAREIREERTLRTSSTQKERVFDILADDAVRGLLLNPEPLGEMLVHLCEWSGFEFAFSSRAKSDSD